MKRILVLTTMFVALATMSFGQVSGTPHNFSAAAWNPGVGTTEICAPCHQPHGGTTTAATQVLFSQTLSVAAFSVYDSPTLVGTSDASGSSLLCLSCHDNATDLHGSAQTMTENGYALANTVGTNLNSSHPIGVAAGTGSGFQTEATVQAGTGAKYIGSKVECASCHNPHDNTEGNFLITSNTSSALCLDCHIK